MSPGRAVDRRTAFPLGADPKTTMSAITPEGDCAMSPPARETFHRDARASSPSKNSFVHRCRTSAGSASERKTASGSPPIAAMSLNPRTRQRCPTTLAECHSRRKCTFSRQKSVVTSSSCPRGGRSTAQSSPIPRTTAFATPRPASRRILSINARSLVGTRPV